MKSAGVLKLTVTACAVLAASIAVGAAAAGHAALGMGIAAGLLLGSMNGYLIQAVLGRGTPFVAGSLIRIFGLTALVFLAALLLRSSAWTVPLGIGVAQLVMVGAGVRQGAKA
ncbi:MAG TPA: hypothetical protein VGG90_02615 [Candidatus Dormibacteraeota bacterium]|jgi:hypothetical protein